MTSSSSSWPFWTPYPTTVLPAMDMPVDSPFLLCCPCASHLHCKSPTPNSPLAQIHPQQWRSRYPWRCNTTRQKRCDSMKGGSGMAQRCYSFAVWWRCGELALRFSLDGKGRIGVRNGEQPCIQYACHTRSHTRRKSRKKWEKRLGDVDYWKK